MVIENDRIFIEETDPIQIAEARKTNVWSSVILLTAIAFLGILFLVALLRGMLP